MIMIGSLRASTVDYELNHYNDVIRNKGFEGINKCCQKKPQIK